MAAAYPKIHSGHHHERRHWVKLGDERVLQKRFKQEKKKYKGHTVTPIVIMSISTLERSMRALTELPFETILEDRMQQDKQLTRPFEAASKRVQRGVAGRLSVHMDVLEKLTEEVTKKYEVKDPIPPAEMVG